MRLAIAGLACAGTLCACSSSPGPKAAPTPDVVVLHTPNELPGDFLDRQTIHAVYGKRSASFDAVLQKRGNEIVLIGMTPFGSRAFVLKQTGLDVSFESFVPQELPFPPSYILLDVERVFFGGVAPAGQALPDGSHEAPRDAEIVSETWQGGLLKQRRFRKASGQPAGDVVIDYGPGMPPGGPPPEKITYSSGWYGYRLEIVTVGHQAL
jgi:hypothetical protein